ncbi:MAG: glutamate--tRNA ligase family protein, partial [Clostridiales bacterium]
GDVAVEDYRAKGYLKEALVNFVALLGWNAGDDKEYYELEEMIEKFSLERVNKSGAVFNIEKLNWLNAEHLRKKPDEDLLCMLKDELEVSKYKGKIFSDKYLLLVIEAMKERVSFVKEYIEKSPYFFEAPEEYDQDVIKKRWKEGSAENILKLAEKFSAIQDPVKEDYETALRQAAEELGVGTGKLIHPVRLAVSGVGGGPGLFDILYIIGKDETISRLKRAAEKIKI